MKTKIKLLTAALVAGAAAMFAAAPAQADTLHVALNLGNGGYYAPAPVVRQAHVRQAVVYRPVYRPAYRHSARVVYVQPRHWKHHGHHGNHGRVAYGYGRGW
jgi:hypothetical protein